MVSSPSRQKSSVAFDIAANLESYETFLDDITAGGGDPSSCRRATRLLQEIAMEAAALPQLTAAVVELSLRHPALLRLGNDAGRSGADDPSPLHAEQLETIRGIRTQCLRLLVQH